MVASLLSLDPVPILETTDSGLLLFRDNVQLNYNKLQDVVNKLKTVEVYTSATRPSTPAVGQIIFETDSKRVLVWTGSVWKMLNTEYAVTTMSNFTGTAVGSPMTIGTFTAFANPGFPARIVARATGYVLDTTSAGAVDNNQWLEGSFDGGSTWTVGPGQTDTTNATNAKFRGTWSPQLGMFGTPTGSIQVRIRCQQNGGGVGMKVWTEPYLIVEMTGAI